MNYTKELLLLAVSAVSAVFSGWLYWGGDIQLEKAIIAKEWQSKMVTVIDETMHVGSVAPLRKVDIVSKVKYLPNGTYIRVATVHLFSHREKSDSVINISESGKWEVSDNYLLISPKEFKGVSSPNSKDFTDEQLQLFEQLFKMEAQQSPRIDIVNNKTLLLTSLSHGSTVLFSN